MMDAHPSDGRMRCTVASGSARRQKLVENRAHAPADDTPTALPEFIL